MKENWQYLTWEVSLGSTHARLNCPKSGGPGRTQVLRHHISQAQGHRAGREHDGVGLVDRDAHLTLALVQL